MIGRLVGLAVAATIALVATGCNTMQGPRRDIERGGEKLQERAKK